MKKSLIIIVCIIAVGLAFAKIESNKFKEQWMLIEDYSKKGKTESALNEIDNIIKNTYNQNNNDEMIKAFINKINQLDKKYPDATKRAIIEVENYIKNSNDSIQTALLHNIASKLYSNYYTNNSYTINKRTPINIVPEDIDEWTKNLFEDKYFEHLKASLQLSEKDKRINIINYKEMLSEGEDSRELRPTLYDFLVYDILDNQKDNPFLKSENNNNFSKQLCQNIVDFHKGENNGAEFYAQLFYIYITYHFDTTSEEYLEKLEQLELKYAELPYVCEVASFIIDFYNQKVYNEPQTDNEQYNKNCNDYLKKAKDICEKYINKFPKYKRINHIKNALFQITASFCSVNTNKLIYPNTPLEFIINYKNTPQVTIKIYRSNKEPKYFKDNNYIHEIPSGSKLVKTYQKKLDQTYPYISQTDTIITPEGLDYGIYVYEITTNNKCTELGVFYVTKFMLLHHSIDKNNSEIIVLDRQTGEPSRNAKIIQYKANDSNKEILCDQLCIFKINHEKNRYSSDVSILCDKDKFHPITRIYSYNYYRAKQTYTKKNATFFTDRAIYRPGQKILYKVILWDETNEGKHIISNDTIKVVLYDSKSNIVSSKSLITNQLGSASGEFSIPQDALSGNFHLECESSSHYFKIEEYKRPTFEILFDNIKETYTYGDTIKLHGTVKNYSGSVSRNTTLKYSIKGNQYARYNFKENTLDFKEISTDENGEFNITIHLPKSNDYSQIIVDVMATDNKGESHNETKSFFLNKESLEFSVENEFLNQKEALKDITINVYNHDHVKYKAPVSVTLQKIKDIEKINDKNYKVEKEIWTKTLQPNEVIASSELKSLASGRYRLTFKIKDNKGREIENTKDFLLYSIYDKKVPEKTYDFYVPIVTQCKVGENATILLGSSDKSYVLLQIFANNHVVDTKWINIDNEIKTINIPYLKEYGNNINVTLTFAKESELYTHTANITLKKEPKNKPILGFESFRDLVTPGSKEKWVLKLKADSVSNYELCCTLYDQSLDAYQKNNWYIPNDKIMLTNSLVYNWQRFYFYETTADAYSANKYYDEDQYITFDLFIPCNLLSSHRLLIRGIPSIAPGVSISTSRAKNKYGYASVEMAMCEEECDEEFVASSKKEIDTNNHITAEDLNDVKIRTNFAETAFFYPHVRFDETGTTNIEFTMPESLTRWKFMGLVHDKSLNYTQLTEEIECRKTISITSNRPRFVTIDDQVQISAIIENLSSESIQGNAYAEFYNGDKLLSQKKCHFAINEKGTQQVNWIFTVPDIETLTIKVIAKTDNDSDGEMFNIPVRPNKTLLTETLPFVANGKNNFIFNFDEFKPNANNKSFVIEYTNNPIWYAIQALPQMSEPKYENSISYIIAYFTSVLGENIAQNVPNLKTYIDAWTEDDLKSNLNKNEDLKITSLNKTPWVNEAMNESKQKSQMKLFFDTEHLKKQQKDLWDKLSEMQLENGSFPWFKGMNGSTFNTLKVAEILCQMQEMGIPLSSENQKVLKKSVDYLDKELTKSYNYIIRWNKENKNEFYISRLDLDILYVKAITGMTNSKAENYFLQQTEKYWTKLDLPDQAIAAIILNKIGKKTTAKTIVASLLENAVNDPNEGMYWPKNTSYNKVLNHCTIIKAISSVLGNDTKELIPLKIWLIRQKQTQLWKHELESINAIYALTTSRHPSTEVGDFSIKVGNVVIDKPCVKGTEYIIQSFDKEEIKPNFKTISVTKNDDHFAFGCAYWQHYDNTSDISSQKGNKLNIEKKIFIEKQTSKGKVLEEVNSKNPIKVGDKVTVRITVKCSDQMDFVMIEDQFASGFEPTIKLSGYRFSERSGYYLSYTDSSILYFFDYLSKGTYVFEYQLNAERAGLYTNGIGQIQCLYAPEFINHTAGSKLEITNKH